MNRYPDWLKLDFDPFAPAAASRDFYCSGHRQQLLDQIVEYSLYSNAMIAVTGPLGAGKSTLATNFCDRFAEEAVCVKIGATLFMNQSQFLDALHAGLPFNTASDAGIEGAIDQICQYAAELDLEARSLILIIDDAHELSAEVLELLARLLDKSVDSSIHALLFGESQLDNLLQSTLSDAAQERLAVFPLDGFASDETQEYIRFKLVTAGFTKDVPVAGGVMGSIHNTSQGMPGTINRLIADALNTAAPAIESNDFDEADDLIPIYSGERMEQIDDDAGLEEMEREAVSNEQHWIANMQPGYWAVAATLVLLLAGTLLFWDTEPAVNESVPIAVAAAPSAQSQPETAPADTQSPAVAVVAESLPEASLTETETLPSIAVAEPAEIRQSPQAPPAAPTEAARAVQAEEPAEPAKTPEIAAASSFEERLLQASPQHYAVQLLASHSEANIQEFLTQFGSAQPAGYFETRYQGKPWFVAVLADFDDRDQASAAISSLPAKLRSNEPWIRSVAGIQTDIRALLSTKLVSVQ